jgi:hypothetical protein
MDHSRRHEQLAEEAAAKIVDDFKGIRIRVGNKILKRVLTGLRLPNAFIIHRS